MKLEPSNKELVNTTIGDSLVWATDTGIKAKDINDRQKEILRRFSYYEELEKTVEIGKEAIKAMTKIREIFDSCPSYDVDAFKDIDLVLMSFEKLQSDSLTAEERDK